MRCFNLPQHLPTTKASQFQASGEHGASRHQNATAVEATFEASLANHRDGTRAFGPAPETGARGNDKLDISPDSGGLAQHTTLRCDPPVSIPRQPVLPSALSNATSPSSDDEDESPIAALRDSSTSMSDIRSSTESAITSEESGEDSVGKYRHGLVVTVSVEMPLAVPSGRP